MTTISELMTGSVLALESCIDPGRKWTSFLKNIPMYEFVFSWKKINDTGEVTASVMGLLSLELPFTASQGDKVKQL